MRMWIAGPALAAGLATGLGTAGDAVAQDVAAGQKVFVGRCAACHQTADAKSGALAPSLKGVYGRPVAALADFRYTPAMKAKGGRWGAAELDALLASPVKYVPGSRMLMAVPDATDRANLIAYLKTAK